MVYKFKDIEEKIIPFFKKYLMHGVKALYFAPPGGRQGGGDWCKVAEMMKQKNILLKTRGFFCED